MQKFIAKLKSLDKGTIIRTVMMVIALANQVVAVIGMSSYAAEPWYQILSLSLTAVVSIIAAWKNNNFTYFAQLTGKVLDYLKDGKLTQEEVLQLLEKAATKEDNKNTDKK